MARESRAFDNNFSRARRNNAEDKLKKIDMDGVPLNVFEYNK